MKKIEFNQEQIEEIKKMYFNNCSLRTIGNNFNYCDDNITVPEIVLDIIYKMKGEKNAKKQDNASNF